MSAGRILVVYGTNDNGSRAGAGETRCSSVSLGGRGTRTDASWPRIPRCQLQRMRKRCARPRPPRTRDTGIALRAG